MTPSHQDAFLRTVLSHRRELVSSALRFAGSADDAEDLVQETVMRAWLFRAQFEHGTNVRAWLQRILRNTFINHYRKRRREREILAEHLVCERATRAAGASPAPVESLSDEVTGALASLPREFREVLSLVDANDASYREAAEELECPVGTIMSRLHRARRAMQGRLGAYAAREGYVAGHVQAASRAA
jgi:RNA polymerase sigma-70 factor, ECF subfamily